MRYNKIRKMDISNGEGVRVSLFTQGCHFHCKDCFNPETWGFNGGEEWTQDIENKFIELCKRPHVDCVSILGGEPFDQDEHIYWLLKKIKLEVNKPLYLWSGYEYEYLINRDISRGCLMENLIDYLIDGEFQLDKRDLSLKLRGSSNQRIIDVQESLRQNKVITI